MAGEAVESAAGRGADEAAVKEAYTTQYANVDAGEEFNASHILVETEEEATAVKNNWMVEQILLQLPRRNPLARPAPAVGLWDGLAQARWCPHLRLL